MIPHDWIPYRREHDDELLGYIVPRDDGHAPVTVFGYPLGEPGGELDAERVLDATGLSYLADRWELALDDREHPIAVQLVEAGPDRLVVKSVDYAPDGRYNDRFELDVPEPGRLRRA